MRVSLLVGLLCIVCTAFAQPQLRVEPKVLTLGGEVELSIQSDADGTPDLSTVKQHFDIINAAQQNSIQIINGRVSRNYEWVYALQPKQAGTFRIGPISIGSQKTNAVNVVVEKTTANNQDFIFISETDTSTVVVGGQILYSLKLLFRTRIGGQVQLPTVPGVELIKLVENKRYRTIRQGGQYEVFEWRYALKPSRSGTFRVGEAFFVGQAQKGRRMQRIRVGSKPINLTVLPRPVTWDNQHVWLPAKSVKIWEKWEPRSPIWVEGENVEREIVVEIEGLKPEELPKIEWQVPNGIKAYDQPAQRTADHQEDTLRSRITQKWILIANQKGNLVLPEVRVPWWNYVTNTLEYAVLEQRDIRVDPSVNLVNSSTVNAAQGGGIQVPGHSGVLNVQGRELESEGDGYSIAVMTVMIALGLSGWIVAVLLWLRMRTMRDNQSNTASAFDGERRLQHRFEKAVKAGNHAQAYHWILRYLTQHRSELKDADILQQQLAVVQPQVQANEPVDWSFMDGYWQQNNRQPTKNAPPPLYP